MNANATPTQVLPTASLGGATFKVSRAEVTSEGHELFVLSRGRVEFLVTLADGAVHSAFNYNTMGPTVVKGRRVEIEFEAGQFFAL